MNSKSKTLCAAALLAGAATAAPTYPVFSWETVPVMLHFGSAERMTDEQVEMAADLSDFICLEKNHGVRTDRRFPEKIAGEDAARIRKANPAAKVLMYWNTLIAWPFTSYNQQFAESHPDNWTLRDRATGELLLKTDRPGFQVCQYNLLNPDVRAWWAETIGNAVNDFGFDGFFMDACSQPKRPLWIQKGWGKGTEAELDAAVVDLMKRARKIIGPNRFLVYNGLRTHAAAADGAAAGGMEFLPHADGTMIEHFDGISSKTKEDVLLYWQMAAQAAKAGKIVIYKGWPDQDINWMNQEFMALSQDERESIARNKITYPLACYLIGAQENSYFCYGWGYDIADGQLIDYPEYGKKLGAPKGDAVRKGWVFRREFAHAKVMVDLEKREGTIQWLEE